MDSELLLFFLSIGCSGLTPPANFRVRLRGLYNLGYSAVSIPPCRNQFHCQSYISGSLSIGEPEIEEFDVTHIILSTMVDPSRPRGVYAPTAEWGLAFNPLMATDKVKRVSSEVWFVLSNNVCPRDSEQQAPGLSSYGECRVLTTKANRRGFRRGRSCMSSKLAIVEEKCPDPDGRIPLDVCNFHCRWNHPCL